MNKQLFLFFKMENSGSTPAFTVETFVQTFGTFEEEVLLDKNKP